MADGDSEPVFYGIALVGKLRADQVYLQEPSAVANSCGLPAFVFDRQDEKKAGDEEGYRDIDRQGSLGIELTDDIEDCQTKHKIDCPARMANHAKKTMQKMTATIEPRTRRMLGFTTTVEAMSIQLK